MRFGVFPLFSGFLLQQDHIGNLLCHPDITHCVFVHLISFFQKYYTLYFFIECPLIDFGPYLKCVKIFLNLDPVLQTVCNPLAWCPPQIFDIFVLYCIIQVFNTNGYN